MDQNNRHPLGAITNRGSLSMLEALIPFVEYPLKLPLALFIKFTEIRMIINAFHSLEDMTRLGLHNASNNPTDMLCSLTGIPPEMLNMLFSLSENFGNSFSPDMLSGLAGNSGMDFSNLASMFQSVSNQAGTAGSPPPPPFSAPFSGSPFSGNPMTGQNNAGNEEFNRKIQNIFAEYDMLQAAQFDQEPITHTEPFDMQWNSEQSWEATKPEATEQPWNNANIEEPTQPWNSTNSEEAAQPWNNTHSEEAAQPWNNTNSEEAAQSWEPSEPQDIF